MRILVCISIIAIFALQNVSAQDKTIDSLKKVLQIQKDDTNKVNTLNELSQHMSFEKDSLKAAIEYSNEALSLSKKINFKKGEAEGYSKTGNLLAMQGAFAEAMEKFQAALKIWKDIGSKKNISDSYFIIAQLFYEQGNAPESLKIFYIDLKLYGELNDKENIAWCWQCIGIVYAYQGNISEALKSLYLSLKNQQEINNRKGIAHVYDLIGGMYSKERKYKEALQQHLTALKIFQEPNMPGYGVPMSHDGIGKAYEGLGDLYYMSGKKNKALKEYYESLNNYFKALHEWEKTIPGYVPKSYLNIGKVYIKLGKISEAKSYLTKSLQSSNDIVTTGGCFLALSALDSISDNYKQAFRHYKMYVLYNDSLNNHESIRKSEGYRLQYEFDKKEAVAKAEQDKKDAITKAEIQNQKIVRNFSYIGAFAVLSFTGVSFYRYRHRRKLQSQQEMLNERLRISRELHDDIGSTLGSISIYSEVAKNRSQKNENADEAIAKIGVASRELIDKMSDIVWSINPDNESFEQLKNRMQVFAAMMLTPDEIVYNFYMDETVKSIYLTAEERKNIYLIYKEAIHNIVKYAECSHAEIRMFANNALFVMQVKDDGKGFDINNLQQEELLGGNGIKNIKARAESMNAHLDISSKLNEGTMLELKLIT